MPQAKRFLPNTHPVVWLMTICLIFYFGFGLIFSFWTRFLWTNPGFTTRTDLATGIITINYIEKDSPADTVGLKVGDAIVKPDGQPFTSRSEYAQLAKKAFRTNTFELTIKRENQPLQPVSIQLPPPDWQKYSFYRFYFFFVLFFIPLMCFSIGLIILWKRWEDRVARMGGLFFISIGFLFGNEDSYSYLLIPAWVSTFFMVIRSFGTLSGYLCYSFFTEFPVQTPLAERTRLWKRLYLAILLTILPISILSDALINYSFKLTNILRESTGDIPIKIEQFLWMIGFLGLLGLFHPKLRGQSEAGQHAKFKVLMFGTVVGCGPFFSLILLDLIRFGRISFNYPPLLSAIVLALYMVFPLSFGYTVVRHRVLGVQQIVRNSLQYAFVSRAYLLVEISLLYVIWKATQGIVSNVYATTLAGNPPELVSKSIFYLIGFSGLGLMWKVNPRLQTMIDRRFFRSSYQAQQVLTELSQTVRQMTRAEDVLQRVAEQTKAALFVDRIGFLVHAPFLNFQSEPLDRSRFYSLICRFDESPHCYFDHSKNLPSSSFVINKLKEEDLPLDLYFDEPDEWMEQLIDSSRNQSSEQIKEYDLLRELDSNLLVPIATNNLFLGFLSLGPKRSEEPYTKEDKNLLLAVAEATAFRLENAQLIKRVTQEATLRKELEIARTMQQSLLPAKDPILPGVEVAGYSMAANDVGGDYYDYFLIDEGQLAIAVGDVTGHGVSSGLLMACAKGGVLTLVSVDPAPKAVMFGLNNLICTTGGKRNLMSFIYAVFDNQQHQLELTNAGHPYPYLYKAASGQVEPLEISAYPLGVKRNTPYQTLTVRLQPGDALVFYTDGIVEAQNLDGDLYGYQRLEETIAAYGERSALELKDAILESAKSFAGGQPFEDDITLVVLRVQPGEH